MSSQTVGQKSFYGNAKAQNGKLYSYGTLVAGVVEGVFIRHWAGYSATTLRHVNAFRLSHELPKIVKSEWEAIEVCRG